VLLLSVPAVQTKIGSYVTNRINQDYKTKIFVNRIGLQFNGDVELKGVLIKDYKNNTLMSAKEINTSIINIKNLYTGTLNFGDIDIDNFLLHVMTYKGETDTNLDVFVARFDEDNPRTKSSFLLSSSDVTLTDSNFKFSNQNLETVHFLDFSKININATNFLINGANVSARINTLNFKDSRGLDVKNLTTNFSYTLEELAFKDLTIKTKNSVLDGNVIFNYDRKDFVDFVNKVNVSATFKNSKVDLEELNVFYNEFGQNKVANFNANLSGTLNDLTVTNLQLNTNASTKIDGDINFKNLFSKSSDDFSMEGDFSELSSNYYKLTTLLPNVLGESIPKIFKELGNFKITGTTKITTNTIDAKLQMATDIGYVKSDLAIQNVNSIENASYKGNVVLTSFNLGKLLGEKDLGNTTLNLDINGKGFNKNNLNSSLKGNVSTITYNKYTYKNITVNGTYAQDKFNGNLVSKDKNLQLEFNGLADLSKKQNRFDFKADVKYADLKALNFYKKDQISLFKGFIEIDMVGTTIDDAVGTISFVNTIYTNQNDTYVFKDFQIKSEQINSERLISINSPDIIEGEMKGQFKIADLPKLFENSLKSIYTNYEPLKIKGNQYLDFNFTIYNKIVEVFVPELHLGPNTFIRGKVENDAKAFKLTFKSPQIKVLEYFANRVEVQVDNSNPLFNTYIELDSLNTKYYNVSKFNLINVTVKDTLYVRTDFSGGKKNKDQFDLSLYYTLDEDNNSVVGFKRSNIFYNDTEWLINKNSNALNKIIFDRDFKNFDIRDFLINNENQEINLAGVVRDSTYKDLKLNFKQVELGKLLPQIDSVTFAGTINGKLDWFQDKNIYKPNADLTIDSLTISNQLLGDFEAKIKGNNSLSSYNVNVKIKDDIKNTFLAKGDVDISNNASNINLDVFFNKFSLQPLNPFLKDVLSDIRGEADGVIKVSGLATEPSFNGTLKLKNAGLGVPYLNVDYGFQNNASVTLKNQTFIFNSINITDTKEQTTGVLNGSISHTNFSKWALDLDVNTNRLLILNTGYTDDALYYGTGFIGGNATIKGPTEALKITVNAQTKEGTVFKIPLNDNETFGDNSFIHFLTPEEKLAKLSGKALQIENSQGLEMEFDLDITQDAEIEIVIDKSSGSTIKGRGVGSLLFDINTNGKFNMYGDFVIYEGTYNFFYAGLVQKRFTVQPYVSSLAWNGEPFEALINIKAIYKTRVNPSPLLDNPINRTIPVELELNLSEQLEKPTIDYSFNFPNVESTVKSELNYRLDSREERENQALFLLATGSFNRGFSDVNFSGTITERLNGLINGFFSNGDNKLNIGINYEAGQNRPDYQTDDRFGLTLQTKLSDRILINGKVGVPVGGATESVIAGDVQIDFLLNEEGTLSAKVFNRENSIRNFGEEIGYTQGLGLTYTVDFDTFGELLRKIFSPKKEDEEENEDKNESSTIQQDKKDNPLPDDVGFKKKK
jgi:hypothetical protein